MPTNKLNPLKWRASLPCGCEIIVREMSSRANFCDDHVNDKAHRAEMIKATNAKVRESDTMRQMLKRFM